jgi:predicted MFS family arabinose efflux permease
MSAVQWGTVSTWVAAVGTVAAVYLALWEARRERKELAAGTQAASLEDIGLGDPA